MCKYIMQICITTSTSAGLEQILPWLFYHKVMGVVQFFLFVEGKAAKPQVSAILESIPVSWLFLYPSFFVVYYPKIIILVFFLMIFFYMYSNIL